jgi:hypothetical protein
LYGTAASPLVAAGPESTTATLSALTALDANRRTSALFKLTQLIR